MNDKLCVVMPVYNEREAIGGVLEKWARALDALGVDYVIRPYNDGSKDDSLAVMREAAKKLPRVEVRDKPNGGHGNTILTGYRDAAADGFDWVFQIDSDDEMGPEKFGELWAKRADYDFLVGIRDGRIQQLPRKIISFVSRLCVRLFYGKSVWDVNTPYRLMRVSSFAPFFNSIPPTTFAPNVILSGLAARHRLRSYEIRVPQHDRTTGEVSIKKWKLLKAAARSFWQTIAFSIYGGASRSAAILLTALAALWAVVAFAKSPYLFLPTCDHQVYAMAGKIMTEGGMLYRDFFDHKGPVFLTFNAAGWLLTHDYWGVWILEWLFRSVSVGVFFLGVRRLGGLLCAAIGAVAFILHPALANYPETFALDASILSIGLVLLRPKLGVVWFLVGVFGTFVLFSKQTCVTTFIGLGLYLFIQKNYRCLVSMAFGAAVMALVVVGCLWAWGDVQAWWNCTFRFNALQGGHLRAIALYKAFVIVGNTAIYWLVAISGIAVCLARRVVSFRIGWCWAASVALELFLLSLGSGPYFYQWYCLEMLLLLPAIVAARKSVDVAPLMAIVVCVGAVLGSFPNFARSLQNVAYRLHEESGLADENGEMDYRAAMCRFLGALPKGNLIVHDHFCRYYLETQHSCPIAPYYYPVAFAVPGFLSENEMARIQAEIDSASNLVIVAREPLVDLNDNSITSILARRIMRGKMVNVNVSKCGAVYLDPSLRK